MEKNSTYFDMTDNNDDVKTCSPIQSFYQGRHVFVTGFTGFLGKILVEKLLRSCPSIANVYVLVRSRGGKSAETRTKLLLQSKVFERLRRERPSVLKKIITVQGNLLHADLGINQTQQIALANVSVVFHCAAVRLLQSIRMAIEINVVGTRRVIEFSQTLKSLEAFIHLSTIYSQCEKLSINEVGYSITDPYDKIIDITEWIGDESLKLLSQRLLGFHPNTYTFSKAISEKLVSEENKRIPTVIIRSSTIVAAADEPIPGWIDCQIGISKLISWAGKGLLKCMIGKEFIKVDLVPVDFLANVLITAAWNRVNNNCNDVIYYNITSGPTNCLSWGDFIKHLNKSMMAIPFSNPTTYPNLRMTSNRWMLLLLSFVQSTLPAILTDAMLLIRGKPTCMIKARSRMQKEIQQQQYFINQEWKIISENMQVLRTKMSQVDRQIFNFDMEKIDWECFIERHVKGIKQFILKEDINDIKAAKKRIRRKQMMQYFFAVILIISLIFFIYLLFLKL